MPITAQQEVDKGFDYKVRQVAVPHPVTGDKTGYFMNLREDNDDILGWTTERYGLVQNSDILDKAEKAFASRGIKATRKVFVTEGGAKMRAVYNLGTDATGKITDKKYVAEVPQVGDLMGYRLIAQNSFDRSLRISFALALVRLACINGMTTLEKEIDMVKQHSVKINIDDLITEDALDSALLKLGSSLDVYARLAGVKLTQEQGLAILLNLAKEKVFSEKVRESVAVIWNTPTYKEDSDRSLYNLNNAITQHVTHEITDTRFEYANRVTGQVLKKFDLASSNDKRLAKLWTPQAGAEISLTA